MLQLKGLSLSECADWLAGGAWCCTGWWCCASGGGDGAWLMVWIWTCWIFCGETLDDEREFAIFVLVAVLEDVDATVSSLLTITTPVPLHVVHFVTVVTVFLVACGVILITFESFTSNLISPSSGDTKICVGLEFWALLSFCMHCSQRTSFGPLRLPAFGSWAPHEIHLFLSCFCDVVCCWTMPICSLIEWCNWAGSNDSALTICIWPRFWPSEMMFWAWIMFGCCVTTVTVSECESSWLCVRLCWLRSVRWGNIWLQTSHLKLILEIVF